MLGAEDDETIAGVNYLLAGGAHAAGAIGAVDGFNDFEAFVGQGGRIDGDPLSHLPSWMIQGLLWCYKFQVRRRSFAERAA